MKIRKAAPADAKRLLEIYGPYVRDTAISFEYTVRYDVTNVKRNFTSDKHDVDFLPGVSPSEGIGVGSESIQFSALATPLYEDWIPQANGQTGSSIIPQKHESQEICVTRDGT